MKHVVPSAKETSFNCPHCGALAKQFWHDIYIKHRDNDNPLPVIVYEDNLDKYNFNSIENPQQKERLLKWIKNLSLGFPFIDRLEQSEYLSHALYNINVSSCYNCKKLSIWIFDRLVYPSTGEAPAANPDMPVDVRRDYDEASIILNQSPRGAAALIRLAIQKLCKELGKPGKNINDDIGALVKDGLDPRVQQALDAVRVIGNSAVHPGQIDLRDDRATAEALFKLLNLIVDKTISEPKHVAEVYASLPAGALKAIEERDTRK